MITGATAGRIVLEFVKLLPPMQVFLHLITVKYTRYVVPCLSHDRVKELFRYEELMFYIVMERDIQ